MMISFKIDQKECLRMGIDAPNSVEKVDIDPAHLTELEREILAACVIDGYDATKKGLFRVSSFIREYGTMDVARLLSDGGEFPPRTHAGNIMTSSNPIMLTSPTLAGVREALRDAEIEYLKGIDFQRKSMEALKKEHIEELAEDIKQQSKILSGEHIDDSRMANKIEGLLKRLELHAPELFESEASILRHELDRWNIEVKRKNELAEKRTREIIEKRKEAFDLTVEVAKKESGSNDFALTVNRVADGYGTEDEVREELTSLIKKTISEDMRIELLHKDAGSDFIAATNQIESKAVNALMSVIEDSTSPLLKLDKMATNKVGNHDYERFRKIRDAIENSMGLEFTASWLNLLKFSLSKPCLLAVWETGSPGYRFAKDDDDHDDVDSDGHVQTTTPDSVAIVSILEIAGTGISIPLVLDKD